jgi:cysteine synthase A
MTATRSQSHAPVPVSSVLSLIGNTPVVKLRSGIYAKVEYLNPSGSIKDRIAKVMIERAERRGELHRGSTIIEGSTGNTGIALSMVGAAKGYAVEIFCPESAASEERLRIMQAYGATVHLMKVEDGAGRSVHGARAEIIPRIKCKELSQQDKKLWWARQFASEDNVAAHRDTTGKEILRQLAGEVDAFVASVGTGGTLLGVAQMLRKHCPNVKVYAVEPTGHSVLRQGAGLLRKMPGITDGIMLDILQKEIIEDIIAVGDTEATETMRSLAQEGIFCGVSSGANVYASLKVAAKIGKAKRIVTVLPDSHDRYLYTQKYIT